MKRLFIPLLLTFLFSCNNVEHPDATSEIMQVLNKQCTAWNNGSIETYMEGYWNSDSLLFIGSNGPNYGYDNTLKRYKKAYPTKEKMGTLSFSEINMKRLSDNTYFVSGKWTLNRSSNDLNGYFSLIFKQLGVNWKIIADHSS